MSKTRLVPAGVLSRRDMSDEDKLKMHLVETGLSVRTVNTLEDDGIQTVDHLLRKTKKDLLQIANFGEKTLAEVYRALENLGFRRESNKTKDESRE